MIEDGISVIYGGKEFDLPDDAFRTILQQLEDAPDRAARQITKDLHVFLQRVATVLSKKHGQPWSPAHDSGDFLRRRSGEGLASIMRSIKMRSNGGLSTVEGSISTGKMTIHETGGVIAAQAGGYLTIPLPEALDARGVPLLPSSRDWPNTFIQRSRRGNLIIFQNRGQREPVPLYVLKTHVYIRPRLRMEQTILGELSFFTERLIDRLAEEFAR